MTEKKEFEKKEKEKKSAKKTEKTVEPKKVAKKTEEKMVKKEKSERKISAFHELQASIHASLPVLQKQYEKYSYRFFIMFFSVLFGFLVAGISYYFITKSNYLSFVPQNTAQFLHIKTSSIPAVLFQKNTVFMPTVLQFEDFQKLQNLGVSYISLFSSEKEKSFLLEGVSKSDLKQFFVNTETTKLVQKTGDFYLLPSGKGVFCERGFRKIFCSETEPGLEQFQKKRFLPNDEMRREFFKLPKFAPVTFFIDTKKVSLPLLQVHKNMISSLFGTLEITKENTVLIRTNASVNRALKRETVYSKDQFQSLFSEENTLFYFSGKNFAGQWKESEEYYKTVSPEYALLLKGILQQKVKEVFGTSVQWYTDILPLFKNAYAFAVVENEGPQYVFVAENTELSSVQFLLDAFYKNRGRFTVEKKSLQIDDDTVLSLVESNDEKLKPVDETFEDFRISGYEVSGKNTGIFVVQNGKDIFISSSQKVLKTMLQENGNLSKTLPDTLKNAYEHGYFSLEKLEKLTALLPFTFPKLSLEFLKNISWESQMSPGNLSVAVTVEFE